MKIIREVRNAIDGKYRVTVPDEPDEKRERQAAVIPAGFRETESRVVRVLQDAGLILSQIPRDERAEKRAL